MNAFLRSREFWTDECVEILTRLWKEGFSPKQISEKIGTTRNAVIGKAHRLKLSRSIEQLPEAEPEPIPEPPPAVAELAAEPRAALESWMCRWQTHEPGRFGLFICGHTIQPRRPYCAEHLTMH